jgi:hypothetical protein
VTLRCDGCITVHTEAAIKQGASKEEIAEALGVAAAVNTGAALVYSTRVMEVVGNIHERSLHKCEVRNQVPVLHRYSLTSTIPATALPRITRITFGTQPLIPSRLGIPSIQISREPL